MLGGWREEEGCGRAKGERWRDDVGGGGVGRLWRWCGEGGKEEGRER